MPIFKRIYNSVLLYLIFVSSPIYSDNFYYNSFNNHGVVGLINMPTARFFNEGSTGITLYDGTPDQKITVTSSPYDWLEASFFYTNIQNRKYCNQTFDPVCSQDYKDKGFNFKLRLKEEDGIYPAIALGFNDIAGTGLYSSEYIVGSYGINNIDFHFGLGWGSLNGSNQTIKNPLRFIHDSFGNRPDFSGEGGQFEPSRYFSNKTVSPFYGASYSINEKFLLKFEHDTTKTDERILYNEPDIRVSFGLEYNYNKNMTIGFSRERNDYFSLRFIYKKDASESSSVNRSYKKSKRNIEDNDYSYLIKNLESNGIGVNRIVEKADSIGIELTQFSHPNLDIIEEILFSAKNDSGIKKDIKTEYRIADLEVYSELDEEYERNSKLIYEREKTRSFNTASRFNIRPYLAAREGFFKFAILWENDSEYVLKDNLFFSSNIKYSIKDNFNDLTIPPVDTYPAQVRSDVKEYLRSFENRFIIGRAQLDYHITPKKNNHLMFTAGILEEMFSGYGLEYLFFEKSKNYAVGFEIFEVRKRDYCQRI